MARCQRNGADVDAVNLPANRWQPSGLVARSVEIAVQFIVILDE